VRISCLLLGYKLEISLEQETTSCVCNSQSMQYRECCHGHEPWTFLVLQILRKFCHLGDSMTRGISCELPFALPPSLQHFCCGVAMQVRSRRLSLRW
jgi:hypothetical protein